MSKVWLITGASRGLGRAFTEAVLKAGDRVVATARNPEQLVELRSRYGENIRTVPLDVTNEAQAKDAFEAAFVDASGHSLVQTIGADRDAFFNISETTPALSRSIRDTLSSRNPGQAGGGPLGGASPGFPGSGLSLVLVCRIARNEPRHPSLNAGMRSARSNCSGVCSGR